MNLKFYRRTDATPFSQELINNYNDKTFKAYEHYIDNLFTCGLTLDFKPKYQEAYWRFGSDYAYSSDFFKFGDPSILVTIFKGLVICEFHILKHSINSVSPVTFLSSILTKRLSTALYNEIAHWVRSYPANDRYRNRFLTPIFGKEFSEDIGDFRCDGCTAYSRISKISNEETKLTYSEYSVISRKRTEEREFARNKCPKCKRHQLKTNQTRWGRLRICSNYPECSFMEKLK